MPTKTKKKKIAVIYLGNVRDTDWEEQAELGLNLLRKIREAGLKPSTEAPYISDSGDVPLVITVEMEESPYKLKKNVKLLESIIGVDNWASVSVYTEEEWYAARNDHWR